MKQIDLSHIALGIELGSTRIKAVLIDSRHKTLASGSHNWENRYKNGLYTYSLEDIRTGLQTAYADLKADFASKFGQKLSVVGSIGISGMMHGYVVLDKTDNLLVPFRTWRCANAQSAAKDLTGLFDYHIPARWSIAHLYQAILDGEKHVKNIAYQTTLAGLVHFWLTGERLLGVGDVSGMFPIDLASKQYHPRMLAQFDAILATKKLPYTLKGIFPGIAVAGENAGHLTQEGALLLDPTGDLVAGIAFCPPEGDAGTGMAATNSIRRGTANISAGTSVFAMLVLEKELSKVHPEIDLVTTPKGDLVAMVHCNNCTSDIDAWTMLFSELGALYGIKNNDEQLFEKLFTLSLQADPDCGDVLTYNYVSSEHITHVDEGRPMVVRTPESKFTLANFVRSLLYSSVATVKIGMDILTVQERVAVRAINAHGGIFKTRGVMQKYLAAAINAPVTVRENAGEGGAWGMAVLAMYALTGKNKPLEAYLDEDVFADEKTLTVQPEPQVVAGFAAYMQRYIKGLKAVQTAVTALKE
jgi:sugar (pentulose or hexulose) kinase